MTVYTVEAFTRTDGALLKTLKSRTEEQGLEAALLVAGGLLRGGQFVTVTVTRNPDPPKPTYTVEQKVPYGPWVLTRAVGDRRGEVGFFYSEADARLALRAFTDAAKG